MSTKRENINHIMAFERDLTIYHKVRVRWTNCGHYPDGIGEVVRINEHSVGVKLDADVHAGSLRWNKGQVITVPKMTMGGAKKWSCNNRCEPVDGYESYDSEDDLSAMLSADYARSAIVEG